MAWSPVQQVHATAERGLDRRTDPVLGEEPGHEARVDQDVLVAFVVAAPGAVLVPKEHGHLADERGWGGRRALGDDGPLVGHPGPDGEARSGFGVAEVAEIQRHEAARPQGLCDRDEGSVDRGGFGEVAQLVPDRDDRVRVRDRIVRKDQLPDLPRIPGVRPRQLEHRGRGIGRDHPVTRVDQVSSEESAAAAELDDQAVALAHRPQQLEDAGRAVVGVEAESQMVDQREIAAVVGGVGLGHPGILAPVLTTVDRGRPPTPSNLPRCRGCAG
jgi:hypothetical protein